MPTTRKTTREKLPCELTNEELVARARSLAAAGNEVEEEKNTQAFLRSQMKSKMAEKLARRDVLNNIVASGKEYRDVNVVEIRDYNDGTVMRCREDTGEIIEQRPMVDDERQIPLDAEYETADPFHSEVMAASLSTDTETKYPLKKKAAKRKLDTAKA